MSVLDDTFTFYKKHEADFEINKLVPTIEATLTGTELPSLAGFVATAPKLTTAQYNAGVPAATNATISFDATVQFGVHQGKNPPAPIPVTLTASAAIGGGYSMKIVLPWSTPITVDCVPEVDATSGVVYGSQGNQFVTLVLKPSTKAVVK
jgi:hypothetical protein